MSPDGPQGGGVPPDDDRSVGELVLDVSERVSILIREEIELAKTEVREKVTKLVQGSVVGIAAGVFALMGLAMLMHGIAWLLNDLFFSGDVWAGFLIEALFWFWSPPGRASSPTAPCKPALRRRRTWRSRRLGARRRLWRRAPVERLHGRLRQRGRRARGPGGAGRAGAQLGPDPRRHRAPALQLSRSVEALRGRVTELTDWRRQIREHRREVAVGAAVAGFAIGGLIALRRRR